MRAVFVLLPLCMGSIAAEPIAAQIKGQHYAFLVGCSDYSVAINAPRPQPFAPDASNGNNANRPPLTSSAANNAFGGAVEYYEKSPKTDPLNTTPAKYRVLRGGSWLNNPRICRSAVRFGNTPDDRDYVVGFRVLLSSP